MATVRLAHLTDLHLQPERGAYEGVVRALAAAEREGAEMLLLGGDVVMNSASATRERADAQWDLWTQARAAHPDLPLAACLGNQDCWGWNLKASGTTGKEPLHGKALAMARLGMDQLHDAFDLGAWRIVVLDSVQRGGKHGFTPRLDLPQRFWLERILAEEPARPTLVMSHVPLVPGPGDFFTMNVLEPTSEGIWPLPAHQVHADGYSVVELLRAHPGVRLCLAGHTHVRQRIEYGGLAFIGSPAVCGAWWRGEVLGVPPGFTVIDLHDDGAFETRFVDVPLVI